jgi:hypothetical protein
LDIGPLQLQLLVLVQLITKCNSKLVVVVVVVVVVVGVASCGCDPSALRITQHYWFRVQSASCPSPFSLQLLQLINWFNFN